MKNCIREVLLITCLVWVWVASAGGQSFTKITDPNNPVVSDQFESGGGAWIDVNGDGYLDLFVANGNLSDQNNSLYINNRNGTFTKITTGSIVNDGGSSIGSTWGDFDRDGNLDVFVTNRQNFGNFLYRGNGDGTFVKVASGGPVTDIANSNSSSWVDLNNDGILDLYVINFQGNDYFYRGNGSPAYDFTRIDTLPQVNDGTNFSISGSWADMNNDRLPDLFVGNAGAQNDAIYKNNGAFSFSSTILADGKSSLGNSWGDYDNDGNLDLFVANNQGQNNVLYHNSGNPGYLLVAVATGIVSNDGGNSVGSGWGDYDNDGDLDLYVANDGGNNYLYQNDGPPNYTFTKITVGAIVNDGGNSFGCVWGDYDNDGFLDMFVANRLNQANFLYHNDGNSNRWIDINCYGSVSNRSAIGTKVRLKATINGIARWQTREVQAQTGYNSQNLNLHFGLGDATNIDSMRVEWPSGINETFTNVVPGQMLTIVEADSTLMALLSPADGAVNNLPSVILRWNRSGYGAPYHLQVATDSTFASGIILNDSTITDTTASVTVLSNSSVYYWRVQPARTIHEDVWSIIRHFTNLVAPPLPPVLFTPSNGAVNQPIAVALRWHQSLGTGSYHLQFSPDSSFASMTINDSTLTDTSRQVSSLVNQTTYYWRVKGSNIGGSSQFSATASFTTIVDTPAVPVLISPANDSTDLPATLTLSWNPALFAASYRLEVSKESTFATTAVVSVDSTTSRQVGPLSSLTKYFWRVRSSNVGGTSAHSPARNFTTIIGTPVLLTPPNGSSQSPTLTLRWLSISGATRYAIEVATDSLLTNLIVNEQSLTDTLVSLDSLTDGTTYYWQVRAKSFTSTSESSVRWHFTVNLATVSSVVRERWNLVSVPLNVMSTLKVSLFPTSSSFAYDYDSATGYSRRDTLMVGRGYWLRFPASQTVSMTGYEVDPETIAVRSGWNLIGSVTGKLHVGTIISNPPGMMTSKFFGYDTRYFSTDTIEPGRGYWVKVDGAGTLTLSSHEPLTASARIIISEGSDRPPAAPSDDAPQANRNPVEFSLESNYPNPFNPSTEIRFALPVSGHVRLVVYDLLGREMQVLIDEYQEEGNKSIVFDATGLPSGIYIYRLNAGIFSATRKMLLLK